MNQPGAFFTLSLAYPAAYLVIYLDNFKDGINMADKKLPELKKFIENVNKKDKENGKKVTFNFVKRKRK